MFLMFFCLLLQIWDLVNGEWTCTASLKVCQFSITSHSRRMLSLFLLLLLIVIIEFLIDNSKILLYFSCFHK